MCGEAIGDTQRMVGARRKEPDSGIELLYIHRQMNSSCVLSVLWVSSRVR